MAYHEQHERKCPTCGERISATAPRCFNCGEYVEDDDEEDDGEESTGKPRATFRLVIGVLAALICVALLVYFLVRSLPGDRQDPARKHMQRLMEEKLGYQLNASSPLTLADVKDKLRRGMPIEEFDRIIAEQNQGPNKRTLVMSHAFVQDDTPRADTKKGVWTFFLRDADLIVVTEFVGAQDESQEQIVSWRSEPVGKH
jgi:hypothetical protein